MNLSRDEAALVKLGISTMADRSARDGAAELVKPSPPETARAVSFM